MNVKLDDTLFDHEAAAVLADIRQLIRASDVYSKRLHKEFGLTTAQALTLRAIQELGEVTTRDLSAVVAISPATLTSVLDRLSTRKLVERYRSHADRRVVHTRLTPEGHHQVTHLPPLLDEAFMARFSALPSKRRQGISSALHEVAQMMNADATDAAPADNGRAV